MTHTLIGVGIANAFVRRRIGFPAVPILAVASNLPDVDALVHLWDDQSAILMRRTFGHSVRTIPIWSLALALIFRRAYPALPLRTTWGLVGLGASVHVFFDLVNSFGVVPLWPLSEWRPEFAVIFIVDLVLTGFVAAPVLLGLVPVMRPHIEVLSRVCLVVAALYVGVCWTGRAMAEDALSAWIARGEAHPEWMYVFPEPLGPHRWRGVFREQNAYRVFLIAVPSRRVEPRGEIRTAVDDLRVRQVRETPLGRRLEWFFKAPVWMVEPSERSRAPAEHPRDVVSAYDLRFRSLVVERPPPFVFRFLVGEHGVVRRWDGEGRP